MNFVCAQSVLKVRGFKIKMKLCRVLKFEIMLDLHSVVTLIAQILRTVC